MSYRSLHKNMSASKKNGGLFTDRRLLFFHDQLPVFQDGQHIGAIRGEAVFNIFFQSITGQALIVRCLFHETHNIVLCTMVKRFSGNRRIAVHIKMFA